MNESACSRSLAIACVATSPFGPIAVRTINLVGDTRLLVAWLCPVHVLLRALFSSESGPNQNCASAGLLPSSTPYGASCIRGPVRLLAVERRQAHWALWIQGPSLG